MNLYENLITLSFELYDFDSNLSLHIHADMIDILDGNEIIVSMWVQDGKLFPTIREHETNMKNAISLDEVLELLKIIKKFEEVAE
jgi:hypothetical protein